ncbi:Uncharacterized membrane protein YsdA, DUF1294 family [Microbacterium sp. cf046]|nr:Uncharacterized membrane protein YsdA, DUF1294 family [Microbacterium sp. cf046]
MPLESNRPAARPRSAPTPTQGSGSARSTGPRPTSGALRPERDMSRPLPAALSWTVLLAFAVAFAVAVVVLGIPLWLPAVYAVASVITFAAYGADKSAARRGAHRVSEQTLLTLGVLGGWPGALVAQQVFRHKTRKRSFRRAFWTSVVANVVVLIALIVVLEWAGWDVGVVRDGFVSLFE